MLVLYVCLTNLELLCNMGTIYRPIVVKDLSLIGDIPRDVDYLQFCKRNELVCEDGERIYGKFKDFSEKIPIGKIMSMGEITKTSDGTFVCKSKLYIWTIHNMRRELKAEYVEGRDYIIRK